MATLYQKNGITVSDDVIEIEGSKFTPNQLWQANISKDGSEFKSVLAGVGCLIVGLYITFSLKWTIFGWILIAAGLLLLGVNLPLVIKGRVKTYLYVVFVTDGNIKNSVSKMISIDDYNEAIELQRIIKRLGNLK